MAQYHHMQFCHICSRIVNNNLSYAKNQMDRFFYIILSNKNSFRFAFWLGLLLKSIFNVNLPGRCLTYAAFHLILPGWSVSYSQYCSFAEKNICRKFAVLRESEWYSRDCHSTQSRWSQRSGHQSRRSDGPGVLKHIIQADSITHIEEQGYYCDANDIAELLSLPPPSWRFFLLLYTILSTAGGKLTLFLSAVWLFCCSFF
jgi:hypothetical protein